MKLKRIELIEILGKAMDVLSNKDMEIWEAVVAMLRGAADTIEKFEK